MAELYEKWLKLKEEKKKLPTEEEEELEKLKRNFVYEILPAAHPAVLSVGGLDQENNCTGYAYGTGKCCIYPLGHCDDYILWFSLI